MRTPTSLASYPDALCLICEKFFMTPKSHYQVTSCLKGSKYAPGKRSEGVEARLSAFFKCRVIDLQVTSERGTPQSAHERVFRLARHAPITCSGRDIQAEPRVEVMVGRRKLPPSKRGNENSSDDTD